MQQQPTDEVLSTKQRLIELRVQRDAFDSEAQAIISELTAPQITEQADGTAKTVAPMGVDTPLVDHEGYPRGDIDLYRARDLRKRLSELKTDRTALQTELERLLERLTMLQLSTKQADELDAERNARLAPKPKPKYDAATGKWVVTTWNGTIVGGGGGGKDASENEQVMQDATTGTSDDTSVTTTMNPTDASTQEQPTAPSLLDTYRNISPFARIDSVAAQSPAASAGLLVNDLIVSFDGLVKENTATDVSWLLQQVGSRVAHAAASNDLLVMVVKRSGDANNVVLLADKSRLFELSLQPSPWAGRGLLGCHLVPI